MAKIRSVGAYPDTDNSLGVKGYTDARFAAQGVVTADVTAAMNTAKAPLSLKTYIDTQDALYVAKTYVDTQDALLTAATQLGAANGIAKLSASAKVTAPTPLVNRAAAKSYHFTYPTLRNGLTGGVFCQNMVIPDPGYPWLPIWTGWTQLFWDGGADSWGGVSIRHTDGHWAARGYAHSRFLNERVVVNIVSTTDKGEGGYYTGSQTFQLHYHRDYGTGTVNVGEATSWFNCLVIPAATSMTPAIIT